MDDVADEQDKEGYVHDETGGFDGALGFVDERGTVVEVPHGLGSVGSIKLNYSKGIFLWSLY